MLIPHFVSLTPIWANTNFPTAFGSGCGAPQASAFAGFNSVCAVCFFGFVAIQYKAHHFIFQNHWLHLHLAVLAFKIHVLVMNTCDEISCLYSRHLCCKPNWFWDAWFSMEDLFYLLHLFSLIHVFPSWPQDVTPGYDNQLGYWIPDVPDNVVITTNLISTSQPLEQPYFPTVATSSYSFWCRHSSKESTSESFKS